MGDVKAIMMDVITDEPPSPDGTNRGGGIEVVVPEGGARMTGFSTR